MINRLYVCVFVFVEYFGDLTPGFQNSFALKEKGFFFVCFILHSLKLIYKDLKNTGENWLFIHKVPKISSKGKRADAGCALAWGGGTMHTRTGSGCSHAGVPRGRAS